MNANAEKWVAALESGEFTQTSGRLRVGNTYCCLGVACELYRREVGGQWLDQEFGPAFEDTSSFQDNLTLPHDVRKWIGLTDAEGPYAEYETSLADQNDKGRTFAEIAAIIRSEPEGLFV